MRLHSAQFLAITLAGAAILGSVANAACNMGAKPADIDPAGWSLIKTSNGHEYVTDFNLSFGDCYDMMSAAPKVVGVVTYACELQGRGR